MATAHYLVKWVQEPNVGVLALHHSLHDTNNSGSYGPTPGDANPPLASHVCLCTSTGAICGKYKIFPKTWQSQVVLAWQKLVCSYKYFLFKAIYKEFSFYIGY